MIFRLSIEHICRDVNENSLFYSIVDEIGKTLCIYGAQKCSPHFNCCDIFGLQIRLFVAFKVLATRLCVICIQVCMCVCVFRMTISSRTNAPSLYSNENAIRNFIDGKNNLHAIKFKFSDISFDCCGRACFACAEH